MLMILLMLMVLVVLLMFIRFELSVLCVGDGGGVVDIDGVVVDDIDGGGVVVV